MVRRTLLLLASSAFIIVHCASAFAMSDTQAKLFRENINYFDSDACGASSSSSVTAGSGAPDGATFPNLDPNSMATSIDNFIQKENSNSALKGLGSTIVASAKNSNVNPFLIVAIAHKESGLADPSDFNVSHGNNSFGREATNSQPHFVGSHLWYKWSSVKASVDYTAPENKGASGGGDMATYLRTQYNSSIDKSDLVSLIMQYAPPSENDTAQYTSDVKSWIKDMVSGSSGASSSTSSSSTANTCACNGSSTDLSGSDNQEKIFNYFIGKGLSPAQSAGIDGNFGQESGWDPNDSNGYLGQWGGSRLTALETFAQNQGTPVNDLGVQLDYVWLELTNGSGAGEDDSKVLSDLKKTTTATDAATIFSKEYERPGDPQLQNRIDYANNILNKYGGNSAAGGGTASMGCSNSVTCTSGVPAGTNGLSTVRQNAVCIAQQELALWDSRKMTPGFRPNSSNSYTKYSQNVEEEWCADFVSWVYNQANFPLQTGSTWRVPFVPNIQSIGEQNKNFHWHPATAAYNPKPGDIAIHGDSHTNIVTEVNGTAVTLIGGDQHAAPPGAPNGTSVSKYQISSFTGDGTTGYVSPD